MKKLSLSLMLNVLLALMLALSLIYPQSVAVSFVAAWAILATVICVVAGGDVYRAGRCRVDFYRADLSCGVGVFPADTYGLPSAF